MDASQAKGKTITRAARLHHKTTGIVSRQARSAVDLVPPTHFPGSSWRLSIGPHRAPGLFDRVREFPKCLVTTIPRSKYFTISQKMDRPQTPKVLRECLIEASPTRCLPEARARLKISPLLFSNPPIKNFGSSPMIKVSVLYPGGASNNFDMNYYLTKHIPMVKQKLGSACK